MICVFPFGSCLQIHRKVFWKWSVANVMIQLMWHSEALKRREWRWVQIEIQFCSSYSLESYLVTRKFQQNTDGEKRQLRICLCQTKDNKATADNEPGRLLATQKENCLQRSNKQISRVQGDAEWAAQNQFHLQNMLASNFAQHREEIDLISWYLISCAIDESLSYITCLFYFCFSISVLPQKIPSTFITYNM